MQWIMVLLGLALAMVGSAAIDRGAAWLGWLDLAAAMAAVLAGLVTRVRATVLRKVPSLLGSLVIVIALVGLALHAPSSIVWWTFAIGGALVLDARVRMRPRESEHLRPSRT